MRKLFLLTVAVAICSFSFGQKNISVLFSETTHDFGTIREEAGSVVTEFTFVNRGKAPIAIKKVIASCGCTTPTWSKAPIAPNGEGKISVEYSTADRPGAFNKSIYIQLGTGDQTITEIIYIKGNVSPKAAKPETLYPYMMGALRVRETTFNFGSLYKGDSISRSLEIYNPTKTAVKFSLKKLPAFLNATPEIITIAPEQKGIINLLLESGKSTNWGTMQFTATPIIDSKEAEPLAMQATVIENFRTLTPEQIENAPVVAFTTKNINLMSVKIGTKRTAKISIINTGKSPLIIRAINSEHGFLSGKVSKQEVKPDKRVTLTIEVDATKLNAAQFRKQIEVVTNDPENPNVKLTVEFQTVK